MKRKSPKKIRCASYKRVIKDHSQSAFPKAVRRLLPWDVIAVCRGHLGEWIPTDDCPYLGVDDPLEMVRTAVANGDLIAAQKKIGLFHYELWAQVPKKGRKKYA